MLHSRQSSKFVCLYARLYAQSCLLLSLFIQFGQGGRTAMMLVWWALHFMVPATKFIEKWIHYNL